MTSTMFKLQVALAQAINNAKPEHVPIADWLQTFRRHVKSPQNRPVFPDVGLFVDASAFWQSAFTRCQQALEEERNQSFLLKQENDALKEKLHALEAQSTIPASLSRKRTVGHQATPSASKRTRLESKAVPASFAVDFDALKTSEPGVKALRHLHQLFILFRGNMYGVEATKLAYHLCQIALALTSLVDSLHITSVRDTGTTSAISGEQREERSSREIVNVIARALNTLLYGIERLGELPTTGSLTNQVIYHSSSLIDSIFTAIEAAAACEARHQLATERTPIQFSRSANRGTAPTSNQVLITSLTNTLIALLSMLNAENPPHAQLLEGLLYHLLQRLGEILHHTTFSGPRADPTSNRTDAITQQILNLPPSDEVLLDPAHRVDRRAMTLIAPALIAVLKRALAAVPAAMMRNKPLGLQRKYYLVPAARDRLQNTLVECIFGPESTGDGSGRTVRDVLRRPELGTEITVPEIERGRDRDDVIGDWFEGELWGLLGWDVLGFEDNLLIK